MNDVPGFLTGFIVNISNPKAYAAFATLFSGFQIISDAPVQSTYVEAVLGLMFPSIVNPVWLYMGSALRHLLHDKKTSRRVNQGFAVLLVASVLMTVFL